MNQSKCRVCGYESLDRQTNGCLYGSGSQCPKCRAYLSFVDCKAVAVDGTPADAARTGEE